MEYTDKEINIAIAERLFLWRWYAVHPRTMDLNCVDRSRKVRMLATSNDTTDWNWKSDIYHPLQGTIELRYDVREGFWSTMEPELLEEKDYDKYPKYGEEENHIKSYYINGSSREYEGLCYDHVIPEYTSEFRNINDVVEIVTGKGYTVSIFYVSDLKVYQVNMTNNNLALMYSRTGPRGLVYIGIDKELNKAICLAVMQLDFRE